MRHYMYLLEQFCDFTCTQIHFSLIIKLKKLLLQVMSDKIEIRYKFTEISHKLNFIFIF